MIRGEERMLIPNNFCALLIRGAGLNNQEIGRIKAIYNEYGKEKIFEFAKEKKILPFAANAFVNCGIDESYWNEVVGTFRKRNECILSFLDKVYESLLKTGVRKMFVSENFAALLSAGSDIALFASGDIDNYADPMEKEKIYHAFELLGCRRKERYSENHQIAAEFFPPANENLPEGFYISVDFYPLARLKLPCFVNANDFVDWNKVSCFRNTSIKLPPPDALAYICMLHISLHSFSRAPDIRLYIDLLNISKLEINYNDLLQWASRDEVFTRLATAVKLSNRLMNTQYPDIFFEKSERCNRVIELVYDKNKNDLIYEPKGMKILQIEIRCDDRSDLHGLKMILFPERTWMKKVYGSNGFIAHIKHFLKII